MARDFYDTLTNHAIAVTTLVKLTTQRTPATRNAVLVQNTGADVLFIGGPAVATTDGVRLAANEHLVIEGQVDLWGISAGTSNVRVIEFQ